MDSFENNCIRYWIFDIPVNIEIYENSNITLQYNFWINLDLVQSDLLYLKVKSPSFCLMLKNVKLG